MALDNLPRLLSTSTPDIRSIKNYKPDQYTGTLRENQGMKNIIHQEIETMKRFGILKENVQTGTLSRDKDCELKFRQTFLTRKDNLSR